MGNEWTPMAKAAVPVTEFEEIDPDELHLVGKGANGFPTLIAKAAAEEVGAVLDDLLGKADAEKVDCPTCKGKGTIRQGNMKCPDCKGAKKVTPEAAKSIADELELFAKEQAEYETACKAKYKQADRDKMAEAGQAMPDGSYPIADAEDLAKAIKAVGRGGADHDAIRKHVIARAKALKLSAEIPDTWNADGSLKDDTSKSVTVEFELAKDGTLIAGANPANLGTPEPLPAVDENGTAASTPGSPEWETVDAQNLIAAGQKLAVVAQMLESAMSREQMEVAVGQADDMRDVWDLDSALYCLQDCLRLVAALAFREEAEATKSGVEKQGRRLSGQTRDAIAASRDALSQLLGSDDPSKTDKETEEQTATERNRGAVTQSPSKKDGTTSKEIDDMTIDELNALLDERESARREAKKAPKADRKAEKAEKASAEEERLAALSDEERAAEIAKAEEKREQKRAAKSTAATSEIREALSEVSASLTKVAETVQGLEDRLSTVEKMAAPGGPVKTRDTATVAKASQKDALTIERDSYRQRADETSDATERQGYLEKAKAVQERLDAVAS